MRSRKLSIIIPTQSKDLEIARGALSSAFWANDLLIADSSKTEGERKQVKEMAKEFGARYIVREYRYSADFKNWAVPQAKNNWVLILDSDEIITEKLQKTIKKLLNSSEIEQYDGYEIARKHFFFGKFLRWGGRYPLYNVRFFKKKCRYEDRDVHAHIVLEKDKMGVIKPKEGDLLHFSDRNYSQFFERLDRYTTYQANYMKKIADKGTKVNWKEFFTNFIYFKSVIKDVWFFIPTTSLLRFFWMYIVRLGFLDGREGLMIATLYGFQDYVSKTKYYHLEKKRRESRVRFQDMLVKNISFLAQPKYAQMEFIKEYQKKLSNNI